jgi:hypothetical protein
MEELKRSVSEVKKELDEELQLIMILHEDQKKVTRVQREKIDEMDKCIDDCKISITQHAERLKAYDDYAKRQNGLLQSLNTGIATITKKVDAFSLSMASRFAETERTAIAREATRDAHILSAVARADDKITAAKEAADEKILAAKEKADKDVDSLRAEWLHSRIAFNWKLIGAVGAIAFLFLLVIITLLTGTFGSLP